MKAIQVDFYILSEQSLDPLLVACRIAEKAWRNQYSVQVNVADAEHAEQLDALMWTFRQDSFLPHQIASLSSAAAQEAGVAALPTRPVQIALCDSQAGDSSMVINAAGAKSRLPEILLDAQCDTLERIAEVVAADSNAKRSARERYRSYRERECALQTHDV